MADTAFAPARPVRRAAVTTEPGWVRLCMVAGHARRPGAPGAGAAGRRLQPRRSPKGLGAAIASLGDPDAQAAIRLTLITAAIAVPLNAVFGLAAAWAIAKFDFRGKAFLITFIDLPFSVSPVVAGLAFVLLLRRQRPARRLAGGARACRSSSRCPGSCSPRCS